MPETLRKTLPCPVSIRYITEDITYCASTDVVIVRIPGLATAASPLDRDTYSEQIQGLVKPLLAKSSLTKAREGTFAVHVVSRFPWEQ